MAESKGAAKGCVLGCAGLGLLVVVGFFGLWAYFRFFVSAEEKQRFAQQRASERRQAKQAADQAIKRLQAARENLPRLTESSGHSACPAPVRMAAALVTSAAELSQFTGAGVVPDAHLSHMPDRAPEVQALVESRVLSTEGASWSAADLTQAAQKVLGAPHLIVYVPLRYRAPETAANNTFKGGLFDGFLVVLDGPSGRPLCHARFQAANSDRVEGGIGVKVGGIKVAAPSMQARLEEDFRQDFLRSSQTALAGISPRN